MRTHWVLLAAATAVLFTETAVARDPVAAEAQFRAGREAATRGDYATACEKFAESQRLDPATGTLINLGDCKQHLELYASAWAYLHEAADALVGDSRLEGVKRRMDAIEPKLSRLTVKLAPGTPSDAAITRDGQPLGPASVGVALPIDRGTHTIAVSAARHEPNEIKLEIGIAESKTVVVEAGPLGRESPPESATGSDQGPASPALQTAGFVVGAVGLASLGAGIATGILTMQRKATVDQHCAAGACDNNDLADTLDAASQGKTFSNVSTATFILGLAAIGAGLAMVVVGSESTATVSPSVAPGSAGLMVSGVFF
jgi:hypothetical protein